jgi:DnaJ-class molecular chaperone
MKQIDDQTYYEVLGVSFNADSEQIQSAYSELLSIYDTDSLSTYSLFSATERQTILDQVKKRSNRSWTPGKERNMINIW